MNIYNHIVDTARKIVICVSLLVMASYTYAGQKNHDEASNEPMTFYFRFDSALLDSGFMDNEKTLRWLEELFADSKTVLRIDSIDIFSYASPDGDIKYNERLARRRCVAVKGYFVWKYPELDQYRIHIRPQGENWAELRRLIESDTRMPGREDALKIIDSIHDPVQRKDLLMKLNDGASYRYIHDHFLRRLRNSAVCMVWLKPDSVPLVDVSVKPAEEQWVSFLDSECYQPVRTGSRLHTVSYGVNPKIKEERPLVALKTNLLFDAALMPNIELEVPIRNHWSIAGEWLFPWWVSRDNTKALQILSGNLEGRYWFGNRKKTNVLNGHFGGLYIGGGIYDIENKGSGYQGEFYIAAGISYGYALRLNRSLNMEFSLGLGYLRTDYRHYKLKDENILLWQNDGRYTWIGPTKVKISLVWVISRNTRKGGER